MKPRLNSPLLTLSSLIISSISASGFSQTEVSDVGERLDDGTLGYFYRVLSDSAYMAPTPIQPKTLVVAEEIHRVTKGWNPEPLTDEDFKEVSILTMEHYQELREAYPVIQAKWSEEGAEILEADEVNFTHGLPALILVEVENATEAPLTIEAFIEEAGPTGRGGVGIPAGISRPILVPASVNTKLINGATLILTDNPDGGTVHKLNFQAESYDPVVVRGETFLGEEKFPGRVYAKGSDGIYRQANEFANNTTLSEKPVVFRPAMIKMPFAYSKGEFEVLLPPGEAEFTLERGFESELTKENVTLEEGEEFTIQLTSSRAIDMKKEGWISGDTHIHWAINAWNQNEDIDLLAMVQRAEDLRVASNLTLYQFTAHNNSYFIKPDQYPMGPVSHLSDDRFHIEMGEEFRNDKHFGHINLINIDELLKPIATGEGSGGPPGTKDYPTNKMIIDRAHEQGGISIEAHNLGPFNASGVAINLIQGRSDSMDQLQPSNYYRFLNSGIRVGLSNGSDHPARMAGVCRVYVNSGPDLDIETWSKDLALGKTFTTSGPLLFLEVEGAQIGEIIQADKGDTVTVKARAWSRFPIGNFQIVSNGEVIAETATDGTEDTLEIEVPIEESMWFTARCSPTDEYDVLNQTNAAHTSAIYVDVDGKRTFIPSSVQVWLTNSEIHRDRFINEGVFEKEEHRTAALEYIETGSSIYQRILDDGGIPSEGWPEIMTPIRAKYEKDLYRELED